MHPSLECNQVRRAQRIGFGHDRNEVDSGAQPLHDFNIQRLQSMAGWSDEVKAGVNTEIDPVGSARLLFLQHVRLVLVVQELYDWHP